METRAENEPIGIGRVFGWGIIVVSTIALLLWWGSNSFSMGLAEGYMGFQAFFWFMGTLFVRENSRSSKGEILFANILLIPTASIAFGLLLRSC